MAAERTLEANLALVVDQCRQLLAADVALIAVSEESLERMILCAQAGLRRADLAGTPLEFLKKRQVEACLEKAGDDEEALFKALKAVGKHEFHEELLLSGIAIPLRMRKATIGILCVASRSKRAFSEFEKDSLGLIGNIAALEITRKRAEERVAQSESQLRLLSTQLLRAQEDERRRLAQELHDGIGQSLSAIKFKIESSMKPIAGTQAPGGAAALGTLVSMIQGTVEEVQRIAIDLRPFILDDLGLMATLRWFLREFQNTYSTLKVECRIALKEHEVPESLKIVVFRIAQEALNNVAKHSRADRVQFVLRKRRNRIELVVRDNGVGMAGTCVGNSGSCGKGFGIASMKERAELSGGLFRLETEPNNGTCVTASWPVDELSICK
jgi:signal transduction histidine kinase